MTMKEYVSRLTSVIGTMLIDPQSLYSGKDGHIRFAHEVGDALNGFTNDEINEFMHSSYSTIYVKYCNLKPILDAKDWIKHLEIGKNS